MYKIKYTNTKIKSKMKTYKIQNTIYKNAKCKNKNKFTHKNT